jgi:hypothetical protein
VKKVVAGVLFVVLCVSSLVAQTYRDGFYFAQDADFTGGQKNQVALEVKGGKIVSANWNIESLNVGARDLKSTARSGGGLGDPGFRRREVPGFQPECERRVGTQRSR